MPLGAVTVLFILFFYKPQKSAKNLAKGWKAKFNQFDFFGTLIFLPMIVCLLLALTWGGSKYPWNNGNIIGLFVAFGVLLIIFIGIQFWKKDNGTVPPRVLSQRSVAAAAWYALFIGGAFFIMVYYLPIWFQAIQGRSPVQSGIANLPVILSLVIFSLISGGLVTALGYYAPFLLGGSVFASIGAGLMTLFTPDIGSDKWIGYQIIFGIGVGLGMQQTLIAVQTVLPKQDVPIGTAIVMFSQTLGGALFISIAQNVFTNRLLTNLQDVVPNLNPQTVLNSGATNLATDIPAEYLGGVRVAYNDTLTTTFYVSVAAAALSIFGSAFVEWKSVKGKKIEMAAA